MAFVGHENMSSPFPGMDPYLERHWPDVHLSLAVYAREVLNERMPVKLVARLYDRFVCERDGNAELESYVGVTDASGLVTVLDFLGPDDFQAEGMKAHADARNQWIRLGANVVEITLVRQNGWTPSNVPALQALNTHYGAVFSVARRPNATMVYPIPLRERLPTLPVPLRESDDDVSLDLQVLLERAYQNGRYDTLNYRLPCDPPLEGEDATWADELLRKARRR